MAWSSELQGGMFSVMNHCYQQVMFVLYIMVLIVHG